MQLIGVNRSPFTRRVAITLHVYGIDFQQRSLSGFGDRDEVRALNPLGRIPALVLDDGEVLLDSDAIVDHLDEAYGQHLRLIPTFGVERRAVLKLAAIAMGACDKGLQAAYERNHRPPEKLHQPWIDDCLAQVTNALSYIEEQIVPGTAYLLLDRLTQADITAFVAERLGRAMGVETGTRMPRLRTLASTFAARPPFAMTEP